MLGIIWIENLTQRNLGSILFTIFRILILQKPIQRQCIVFIKKILTHFVFRLIVFGRTYETPNLLYRLVAFEKPLSRLKTRFLIYIHRYLDNYL